MKPLLICELGLHGEGNLEYHTKIVDQIVRVWSGWPPLAIKVQLWTPGSPWAERIKKEHGRDPLLPLSFAFAQRGGVRSDMEVFRDYCRNRGLLFGCTAHDLVAVKVLSDSVKPDFIKLGARVDQYTARAAVETDMLIVSSVGLGPPSDQVRRMECVSAYPANASWSGGVPGYSCHAVPSLARKFVVQAAPRCSTIEVHVTARPKYVRPLPGDMPCSMSVEQFMELAEEVGAIWSAT